MCIADRFSRIAQYGDHIPEPEAVAKIPELRQTAFISILTEYIMEQSGPYACGAVLACEGGQCLILIPGWEIACVNANVESAGVRRDGIIGV